MFDDLYSWLKAPTPRWVTILVAIYGLYIIAMHSHRSDDKSN